MKTLAFIIVAVALLAGLFVVFKPQSEDMGSSQKIFNLEIKERKIVSGTSTLTVKKNDEVVIKVKSDEEDEFHLHGYDRSVDLKKDEEAQLSFRADLTGRFVYELEGSKIELGALEVQP